MLLASTALLAICYGLVEGQKYDWGTITGFVSIPLVLGLGVVLLLAFLLVQKLTQDKEPLVPFALFRDRNYSVVNWVSGVLAVGMMGIFLPLTIYLQSVLGFSALKAGLTMAPASLVSMFVAPVAGRMTDKIGGKFILMSGLTLFGAGMGWIALIAHPGSSWPLFVAPLIVAGLGMGCIFAPMVTVAMRNIEPRMAGAASGVLNTIRQVGLVIGTAVVGALLQNRLVSAMADQASARSAALPPQVRGRFVAGIENSAKNGIQVGRPVRRQHPPGPRPVRPSRRRGRPHRPRRVYLRLRDRHAADNAVADHPPRRRCTELPGDQAGQACAQACRGRQDRKRHTRLTHPLPGAPGQAAHYARRPSASFTGSRSCAAAEVFSNGYVLAMRWTMLMPIAVVVLAAASCFAIKNKPGQDRPAAGEQAGQMAGTISSPGSSGSLGNNPGSSSGTAS